MSSSVLKGLNPYELLVGSRWKHDDDNLETLELSVSTIIWTDLSCSTISGDWSCIWTRKEQSFIYRKEQELPENPETQHLT